MPTQPKTETSQRAYSFGEMMVVAAAREIHDEELAFVGMRLPMLAFAVAKRTHAPHAIALFENGVIRETPAAESLYTMGDPANLQGATLCGTMLDVMGLLQQGRVHVAFLGAAEVDRFGNLNTTWGRRDGKDVRLPGSGGACDLACLAQRTVILIPHERSRLVERVAFLTSPGFGTGGDWRRTQGLPANSGPSAIVTTKGVLRFGADGEAFLAAVHPGASAEDALHSAGWTMRTAAKIGETLPPSAEELAAIRALDPNGFWTAA
jgi:glutaconate CoA-transferase, subunit B